MEQTTEIQYTINNLSEDFTIFIKEAQKTLFDGQYVMKQFFVYKKSISIVWKSAFNINNSLYLTLVYPEETDPVNLLKKCLSMCEEFKIIGIRHCFPVFTGFHKLKTNEIPDLMN